MGQVKRLQAALAGVVGVDGVALEVDASQTAGQAGGPSDSINRRG
jgi:hypothetical protein